MKKFLRPFVTGIASLLVLAALMPDLTQVHAQALGLGGIQVVPFRQKAASEIFTAVNTQPALYVKYVGTAAGAATVAVAASGDMSFIANGSADTTINQAGTVCGATPGTLDLSTPPAGCDTLGEVVDLINASPNWVAALHGGLRSDSSDNALFTLSAADAKNPAGVAIMNETATSLQVTVTLVPKASGGYDLAPGADLGIQNYIPGHTATNKLPANPFLNRDTTLLYASETITTTDNAGNLVKVLCVVPQQRSGTSTTGAVIPTGSETVTELFRKAGALTTVAGLLNEFLNNGGLTCNSGKLLVRVNGNTTLTAPTVFGTGFIRTDTTP